MAEATKLRLHAPDRDALAAGAHVLGVALDATALAAFAAYAELLAVWSPKVNLISCADAAELVERHLLDALVAAPRIPAGVRIADLGSGAGFPGVPLAIARPDVEFVLVEPRRRRASFLLEVRRKLRLANVAVREQRAEEQPREAFDVVTCRAVWPVAEVVAAARPWIRPHGLLALFCGAGDARILELGDFEPVERHEYRIGSRAARALVTLRAPA